MDLQIMQHAQAEQEALHVGEPKEHHRCSECGNSYSTNLMLAIQGRFVCVACKPQFLQKLQEGTLSRSSFYHAAFTSRAQAFLVDLSLLGAVEMLIVPTNTNQVTSVEITMGVDLLLQTLYDTILISYWGGSIGHHLCGLRVVNHQGKRLPVGWAILRSLSNSFLFLIGSFFALWDSEKRTLSDMICGSWVIYVRR